MTTVPTVPAVLAGENERDYAVRLGLAKQSRGRMSAEAHAALDAARAAGFTFAVKAPAAPRVTVDRSVPGLVTATVAAPRAPKPERVQVEKSQTKIIRAWAKTQDGLKVGDRGVLPPDVIAAYKAAHGDLPSTTSTTVTVRRPTPLDMPRRTNIIGLATANGITHVQDRCGKCQRSVQNCHTDTCPQGPMAYGGVKGPLTLV